MKPTAAWILALGMTMSAATPVFADSAPEQETLPQKETLTKTDTRFNIMRCPQEVVSKFGEAVNYETRIPVSYESDEMSTRSSMIRMAEFGLTRMVDRAVRNLWEDKKEEKKAFHFFCSGAFANSEVLLTAKKDYNKAYKQMVQKHMKQQGPNPD